MVSFFTAAFGQTTISKPGFISLSKENAAALKRLLTKFLIVARLENLTPIIKPTFAGPCWFPRNLIFKKEFSAVFPLLNTLLKSRFNLSRCVLGSIITLLNGNGPYGAF